MGKTGPTSETFLTTYTYSLQVKSNWNSFKKYYFSLPKVTLNWSKKQQQKKTRKTKQSKAIITRKNSILTTFTNSAFLLLEMVNVLTLCQAFLISFFRSLIYFCFTHTDCTLVRKRIPQGGRPSLQRRYMNHSSNYETELRWLDTVFQGQYLPSLRINYVAINKVLEKLPPQLYFLFNHQYDY